MIKAILVVDGDGKRIMARYYGAPEFPTGEAEATFEKKLYDKTMRTNAKNEAEVIMFDNIVTVYRNSADVWFYVVGSQLENELILVHVLMALLEALNGALRTSPDKRTLLDNFDILMLTVDELIDGGMILESDAAAIVNRVGMKSAESGAPGGEGASAFSGDQTFNTMFASAREQIARSLLK